MTTFKNVASIHNTDDQYAKTLAVVREFPYRTSQELAKKVNSDVLSADAFHKRLPDLRRQGLVTNGDPRKCTITGRKAQTWLATSGGVGTAAQAVA